MRTVKEACETLGDELGILVTADQYVKKLEAENDRLKETNRRLHRRCQKAEAAAGEFIDWKKIASEQHTGRYLPALMAHANIKFHDENEALKTNNAKHAKEIIRLNDRCVAIMKETRAALKEAIGKIKDKDKEITRIERFYELTLKDYAAWSNIDVLQQRIDELTEKGSD